MTLEQSLSLEESQPEPTKNEKDEKGKAKNDDVEKTEETEKMPLWKSYRLFVAIIGALVMSSSMASQASMTSAMVCMIKDGRVSNQHSRHYHPHHHNNTEIISKDYGSFNSSNIPVVKNFTDLDNGIAVGDYESWKMSWDPPTQGWVVSSFFFGYYFMQVPSGVIVTKLGPKSSMTFGLIATGILHLLTIPAVRWSLPVLYFVRTVAGLTCGFLFSGIFALVANWCPRHETSIMFSLPCLGFEFGNSFIFFVSLFGCEMDFQGGWPIVFYTLGTTQILVGLLMLLGVSDFPATHRFISKKELKYIEKYRVHEDKATVIPYGKIIRSPPVWAFLMGQLSVEYAYYTIITQGPLFLRDILRLSHWKINTISAIPFMIITPTAFVMGWISDKLVAKKITSTTCMRKFNESISKILIAVTLGILAMLPVNEFVGAFLIYFVAGVGIQFAYIGFMANPGDLSPAHAGFLAGLGQAMTTWVSFVIPVLTGNLASEKTRKGWYIIFFTAVGLQLLCLLIFLIFGSGNLQPWAKAQDGEKVPIFDKNKNEERIDNDKTQTRYRTLSL